jgi:sugar-phosphatase
LSDRYAAALFDLFGTLVDGRGKAAAGASDVLARTPGGRWGIVTSCPRELARSLLRGAGLPEPEVLVGADDVALQKPAPEGYVKAATLLGAAPERCVAFEDSASGLAAARAAGMRAIAVTEGWKRVELTVVNGEFDVNLRSEA